MTTQTLFAQRTYEWLALVKTNRIKYTGAALGSLIFILITLVLSSPWHFASALIGLSLLLYVALRPLTAYFIYDWGRRREYDILAKLGQIGDAACVVEITCGLSRSTMGIYPHFQGNQYYLFNIYDRERTPNQSLQQALEIDTRLPKLPKVFPRQASSGRLPLPDGFAQVVYADFSLHELSQAEDRRVIFEEIRRILHLTEGRLLIAEHNRSLLNFFLLGTRSLKFINASDWLRHFEEAGLQVDLDQRWRGVVNLWRLSRKY